jgi:ABC-2 type transport system ATP-binding protein
MADFPNVVEVENVFKSFKTVKAVSGINFTIRAGQFLALLGPNGAGKTTTVEMIEGIQLPDSGRISILGKDWKNHSEELHMAIGLSLQETQYVDKLTVIETLRLFASFYKLESKRVMEVIELVGLNEKKKSYVVNLSGGQRQRLALGIALINKPKILLLDEPTTGLDPNARREIWAILHQLKEETKTSLLLTTHYMEEAEQLCDYIIIMDHGKVLQEGTLEQLLQLNGDLRIVDFTLRDAPKSFTYITDKFKLSWELELCKGRVELIKLNEGLKSFFGYLEANNLHIDNFESRRITLDDLFISLTGRRLNE